jgi:hypothetical protein
VARLRPAEISPELLFAIHRELERSAAPRVQSLGPLFVPREDPRLVVCDPAFVMTARPFARRLAEGRDSIWNVSILVEASVVVAARASRAVDWRQSFAPPGSRTYAFERGDGPKIERWEISLEGVVVTERASTGRGSWKVSSKVGRDPVAAFAKLQACAERKVGAGFREVASLVEPPARWEAAGELVVDHARAIITDATSAARLRADASLRSALEHRTEGPPGFASFADGACDVFHFPSGRGDGTYGAFWAEDAAGFASDLLVVFAPEVCEALGTRAASQTFE